VPPLNGHNINSTSVLIKISLNGPLMVLKEEPRP
jgi:hypothetical protein